MAAEGWLGVTCTPASGTNILESHQYDVTVNFQIGFNYGGKNGYGASYSITCDGQTQNGTATFSVPSANGQGMKWANIGTKTFRVTLDKSGQAKTISISAGINTGVSPSYVSASTTYTLDAVTWEWSVNYNANGGYGDTYVDYVTYKSSYTTRANWFNRTGYTFTGWNEASNGSSTSWTAYINKPWTWTYTKSITLFAQWKINTYTVSYNANGGSGAPGNQTKTYGTALTLSATKPTRPNYTFKGWSKDKNAVSAEYAAGSQYYTDSSVTLYAVWELAYWIPKITKVTLARCKDTGVLDNYGTYAKVTFNWECCQIIGSNPIGSIAVGYAIDGSTTFTNTALTASGTKGSASVVIGSGKLSVDNQYCIQITVIDSKKGTSTSTYLLSAAVFTIDFKNGGKGVAIGKPADTDNLFDVNWATRIRDALTVNKNATVSGKLNANGGLTIANSPVNDYVIAQGRSGIWTYRKWQSGFAECWCTTSNNVITDTKWGNVYYSQGRQGGYALPFTFVTTGDYQDNPQGIVTLQSDSGNYWFQVSDACTTTRAPMGYVMCPAVPGSALSILITFYVRGRWRK